MDSAITFLVVLAFIFLAIPPVGLVIALVQLSSAKKRVETLESQLTDIQRYLWQVSFRLEKVEKERAASAVMPSAPPVAVIPPEGPSVEATPTSAASDATPSVSQGPAFVIPDNAGISGPVAPMRPSASPVQPAEAPESPQPPAPTAIPAQPAAPDYSAPVPAPHSVSAPAETLEEKIGLTWLTRLGAAVFILGAGFFFKYAVDNDWIGPLGRVAIGISLGLALLAFSEYQRPKAKPQFVHALTGVGLAVLLASSYASFAFYKQPRRNNLNKW
jgi:hypothetical protein